MTLAAPVRMAVQPSFLSELNYPAAFQCDWAVICTAPNAVEADADVVAGGKVVRPGSITRAAQSRVMAGAQGTSLLVALKYNSDVGTPTSPVVRIFGRDREGVWHVLKTSAGAHEITVTVAVATDTVSEDGTYKVTTPIEVDLEGSAEVIVAVQTAFAAGSGTATGSALIAKFKNNR